LFQSYGHLIVRLSTTIERIWVQIPSISLTLNIKKMRILLNEEDFTKLTKGEVIRKDGNEIALQDIGYERLINIIDENYQSSIKQK